MICMERDRISHEDFAIFWQMVRIKLTINKLERNSSSEYMFEHMQTVTFEIILPEAIKLLLNATRIHCHFPRIANSSILTIRDCVGTNKKTFSYRAIDETYFPRVHTRKLKGCTTYMSYIPFHLKSLDCTCNWCRYSKVAMLRIRKRFIT